MADLITRERAQVNIQNVTSFTAEQNTLLDHMIRGCSRAVENYCKRQFALTNYDELYDGVQSEALILKNRPIVAVERVMGSPTTVLQVTNTSTSVQQARVKTTSDELILTRVASGTTTVNTLSYATYATITALKTQIDTVANGWAATIPNTTYSNWPSRDIRPIQGAMSAMNQQAAIRIHTQELSSFEVDDKKGWLIKSFNASMDEVGRAEWDGGLNYWRVVYTAGFEEVPPDVQEACAQWVAVLFHQAARDPGLQYESVHGGSTFNPYGFIPPMIIELLRPYRAHRL